MLSKRLHKQLNNDTMPYYLSAHLELSNNNADYIPLCIAENYMMFDILSEKLNTNRNLLVNNTGYNDMFGTPDFRQAIAKFINRKILRTYSFDHNNIIVANGCSSIIKMLGECICDANDVILTTAPYYIGFDLDLNLIDVEVVGINMQDVDSYQINFELIKKGYEDTIRNNKNVKGILLTNPNNPTGEIIHANVLKDVIKWVRTLENVHLIVDEVYALSIFRENDNEKEQNGFISVADILKDLGMELGDNIHIVWGFSKDFAMSGFRCGCLYSENEQILDYCHYLSIWHSVATDTQFVLKDIISDHVFIDKYIHALQTRLYNRYTIVVNILKQYHIPYIPSYAGLFLIIDLRQFLQFFKNSEYELWKFILEKCSVNISNGQAYHCNVPGFFRVCFASITEEQIITALNKVLDILCKMIK